ncbi:TIR domain-containing protein [Spirosoma arboris]|uniref:hypothetical protein n=1 Tax=Spirosoma arboris TaxID=2682092 RepID=UPI0018DCF9B7|nr:hypothetical protein [Spirosoma arboris]
MSKIYVASSWRNDIQPLVVEALRAEGHEVYDFKNPAPDNKGFSWSEVDPAWQQWTTPAYREALAHPISQAGFESDFFAMAAADVCVLVLPCNRSAHTEAGFMKGEGKPTYVYLPEPMEPELMYKIFDLVTDDLEEIKVALIDGLWHYQGKAYGGYKFNNYKRGEFSIIYDHPNLTPALARRVMFANYPSIWRQPFGFTENWEIWKEEFICALVAHREQHDIKNIDWTDMRSMFEDGTHAIDAFEACYLES